MSRQRIGGGMADSPVEVMFPVAWKPKNNAYATCSAPKKELENAYHELYYEIAWKDQWGCINRVSPKEAAQMLKELFDTYPGGLEEIEVLLKGKKDEKADRGICSGGVHGKSCTCM